MHNLSQMSCDSYCIRTGKVNQGTLKAVHKGRVEQYIGRGNSPNVLVQSPARALFTDVS